MYVYNPRRVLTNKMGGVEPQTNIILLDFFQKFTAHWFFIFGISWFFIGPLDFTDFTGDLRLVTLPAREFDPTLDTMNLQLFTFEMIDSKILEDPHFLGCLQGQWKTLSLDTIDFFLCEIFVLYYRCLLFIRASPGHGCECDDGPDICILYWIWFPNQQFSDPGMSWSQALGPSDGWGCFLCWHGWENPPRIPPNLGPWNIWRLGGCI